MFEYNNRVEGWSESKYWQFLRNNLRKAWNRYPNKYKVLKQARKQEGLGKTRVSKYRCKHCDRTYLSNQVSVDHIVPCGNISDDIEQFVNNMFCSVDGLQVLCQDCHSLKTLMDRHNINKEQAIRHRWLASKASQSIIKQRQELEELGYTTKQVSNSEKRKAIYQELYDKSNSSRV